MSEPTPRTDAIATHWNLSLRQMITRGRMLLVLSRDLERTLSAERTARKEADEHAIDLRNEIIRLDAALAAAPSPLLPGLERAAEICVQEIDDWGFGGQEAGRMAARKCANRCLAEISRLKGEGSAP